MKNTILVVEDDSDIHNLELDILNGHSYNTISAYSGTEAIMMLKNEKCDLVLLDIMLPGMFGNEVIKKIKQIKEIPVIAITSKNDKESKIDMFKNGVDDYITKPFDVDEFLFRISAVLRRYNLSRDKVIQNNIIKYKDIILNIDTHEVKVSDSNILLTRIEFEILNLLMSKPTNVFTKNKIYECIWNDECLIEDNSINVHISNIRSKLAKANNKEIYIQTIWGIGFKMK